MTRRAWPMFLLASVPSIACAHVGVGTHEGWSSGLLHPLTGVDHLAAMIAVGFWAAQLRGHASWLLPFAFLIAMAGGAALGFDGFALPAAETEVSLSVLVLGLLVAMAIRVRTSIAVLTVATFAAAHGYAHGTELPTSAAPTLYAGGFLLSTLALHGIGVVLGSDRKATRAAGAGLAVMGLLLLSSTSA